MDGSEAIKKLRGPVVPVITPFQDDLGLDLALLRDNIQFMLDRGFGMGNGVLLAGGAGGDFPMLTDEERRQVAQAIVNAAQGRVAVVVGCQHTSTALAIELAKYCEDIGAETIQLSPPYYYQHSEEDIFQFFRAVAEATNIRIMVYNTHWEGFNIEPPFMARLAELPGVVAVKWDAPRPSQYTRMMELFAHRLAFVDNGFGVIWNHLMGGTGYVTHLANFWPEHELNLWSLVEKGDYQTAKEELIKVNWPWRRFRGRIGRVKGTESHVVRAAVEITGRRAGPPRPPGRPLDDEEKADLRKLLIEMGAPVA